MQVATAAQMRACDQITIEKYGFPGQMLMEHAGAAVTRHMEQALSGLAGKKLLFFCGKGNNGGDGFVAARHALCQNAKVKVFLAASEEAIAGDARFHLDLLRRYGGEVITLREERDWEKARLSILFADALVDALVGTGFHGALGEELARAARLMNQSGLPIWAVDLPSGVEADTGQASPDAVQAVYTVTFALPKPALLFYPGAGYAGSWLAADIGMPSEVLNGVGIQQQLTTAAFVRHLLPTRLEDAHKGTSGRVLLAAGSLSFCGAACLAAEGAVRAGAGLVTLATPASLQPTAALKLTEVMTRPLPEDVDGGWHSEAAERLLEWAAAMDVLAIGPGIGREESTLACVRQVTQMTEMPLVLDADALYAFCGQTEVLAKRKEPAVLTPHPGELAALLDCSAAEVNADRLGIARLAAESWQSVVVLKGAGTVIAAPGGEAWINPTGNEGMATGGCGDVLTGVIAALLGQGMAPDAAAVAGVYLHGLAGDIVAETGKIGMAAGDIVAALATARHVLTEKTV
nr:NAD(P)H-hydrate dehydratase [uncultured Anaeromusa sp.]